MGLAAWDQARRRLPFGDRLVRHPQRQAAAPPKAGFIRSPIPDLEFHLLEMMPTIGVVLVRHQKETRSVASGLAFYRLLPPKRQDIAVSVQQRRVAGRTVTRQRVTEAVGCPKSAASDGRRQPRMAMPMQRIEDNLRMMHTYRSENLE